ncbi:hypothetical protein FOL46_003608 [Perkinsus olseni]|uniref:Uncharacterized protein n=1 Tax=Perkinsus olseni TaxID=32597 RepID=A0A7J6KMU8_PEROL|nr:hypothetical protein FOL46_003608 [Perkinsus olseni]
MPARSSPKPTKTGRVKRSEEARKRRRAKERDRQRRGNEECAKLDRQLGDLERWAANVRRDWNVTDTTGLTDGTARPGLCPWGIPEGPPTKIQQSLREVLGKVIDELEDSEAGRFVSRWVKLPREQQAGFEWAAVEKAVEKSAERVRSEWPPLLRALSRVFLEGNCEDDSIIDEIDFGVNIGLARYPVTRYRCSRGTPFATTSRLGRCPGK